ncbi:MAG: hypothetical protein DWI25_03065 [Planctomycetota bacterium]|nr:MAG: hypothetical protein DWI25_03065 [Planctomycetota bacterium]
MARSRRDGGRVGTLSLPRAAAVASRSGDRCTCSRTVRESAGGDFGTSISGTGGLSKLGSGRLILSGTNTYSGPTTVSAGVPGVTNPPAARRIAPNHCHSVPFCAVRR